tara:strand:+ start:2468 stop:3466 length:999 start_codon:yes stop_codon:yes gene_type:complete
MTFLSPFYLVLLLVVMILYKKRADGRQRVPILFPNAGRLKNLQDPRAVLLSKVRVWLRFFSLTLIIIALSNPVMIKEKTIIDDSQLNTMIVFDTSLSMMAEDLSPNRLEATQKALRSFLKSYRGEIGLVSYAQDAITLSPLTRNKTFVLNQIQDLSVSRLSDGGSYETALFLAIHRLENSRSLHKHILLISDGKSIDTTLQLEEVIAYAKTAGIHITSLTIGKKGGAQIPIYDPKEGRHYLRHPKTRALVRTELPTQELMSLSKNTNGRYFRLYNDKDLEKSVQELVLYFKSKVPVGKHKSEIPLFPTLIMMSLVLVSIELILRQIILVAIP